VKEIVFARAMPLATKELTIIAATPGSGAAVIGAGVLAIDHAMTAG
jgi:glucokinase